MVILLKLTLKKKRNYNNESTPGSWMNGSHIGRLTFRRCFTMMDKKDFR